MENYKAPDNIYWLFSSSAQSVAAFIGFLAAGLFFSYDRMDKLVEKDETLEEIYTEIKKQYYNKIKALFVLTGLSIISSLVVVYINGFDLRFYATIFRIIVALLNIWTIIWAIFFILFIIDPDKVKKTAEKLIKEDPSITNVDNAQSISRGKFIDEFITLEKLLRSLAEKHNITEGRFRNRGFLSILEIIRNLNRINVINRKQLTQLVEVNKIRNLAAHGEINQIEQKIGNSVSDLIRELQGKL